MRLEPREHIPPLYSALAPILALAASLAICAGAIWWAGAPPLQAYWRMLVGAFGSTFALAETLTRATVLTLTGLAVATAFRARFWNIGAEGQFYGGALVAVVLGTGVISAAPYVLIPTLFVSGAIVGALILLGPAVLKIRWGVDEVVTTLLLNFIILLIVEALLQGPLKDPLGIWPQSAPVLEELRLGILIPGQRLHTGFILALILVVLIWGFNKFTTWGYEVKAIGDNQQAARFAGLPVSAAMIRVAVLSGGIAGIAGVSQVLGVKGNLTLDISSGFGYTGIIVAMLAQLRALAVFPSAVFVSAVFIGSGAMSRDMDVPSYIADVITAVALLVMLVGLLLVQYRVRRQ